MCLEITNTHNNCILFRIKQALISIIFIIANLCTIDFESLNLFKNVAKNSSTEKYACTTKTLRTTKIWLELKCLLFCPFSSSAQPEVMENGLELLVPCLCHSHTLPLLFLPTRQTPVVQPCQTTCCLWVCLPGFLTNQCLCTHCCFAQNALPS